MADEQDECRGIPIRELLDGIEVDVPVMDVRMAGDMLRLYLYGGGVVERRLTHNREEQAEPLEAMKLDDLRKLARRLGIKTQGVHKAELVERMRTMDRSDLELKEGE